MLRDGVGEFLTVARRAVEVDRRDDIPATRKHLVVPTRVPVVVPRALWTAVDDVDERIFLRGIEPRRLEHPPEYGITQRTDEPEPLERVQVQRGGPRVRMMAQ